MNRTRRLPLLLLTLLLGINSAAAQTRSDVSPAQTFISEHPVSVPLVAPVPYIPTAAIASNGDDYLAVWSDQRDRSGIYAARIARDGTILDPFGILLAKTSSVVAVTWTGESYLTAWNDGNSVVAAQVGSDGKIVAPARVILRNAAISARHALISNGKVTLLIAGRYFVLDRGLNVMQSGGPWGGAAYLTGSGEFIIPGFITPTTRLDSSGRYVSSASRGWLGVIACRPGGCITAFANTAQHLAVAPYDPERLSIGAAIELPIAADSPDFDLAATSDGYLLVTRSNILQRLDAAGRPAGPPVFIEGLHGYNVSIASNGRDAAMLVPLTPTLLSAMVTPTGVTKLTPLAFCANAQHDVAIARGNANYLAVWSENDGAYAGRLSFDGVPLDGRGTHIGTDRGTPSVMFDGTSYLIVLPGVSFSSYPSQRVLQIDPLTGQVTSTVMIAGRGLRIASDGSSRVGLWIDTAGGLVAAFLSPNGAIASLPVFLASPPPGLPPVTIEHPSLAWNGTIWLAAWEEQPTYMAIPLSPPPPYWIPSSTAVRGVRFSAALTPFDTRPITVTEPPNRNVRWSRLASDGRDFLLTWTNDGVLARRIPATGLPADAEALLFHGWVEDLVWDGAEYDLAFYTGSPNFPLLSGDLGVSHLRPSGQPFERLAITATPDEGRTASLVRIGNGTVLAAYTRVAAEAPYAGVERAFVATPHPVRSRPTAPR